MLMDLSAYPETVQKLALETRRIVRAWLPRASETEDTAARMFAYAYGPGYKGVVCTVMLSKSGVKLGIAWAALLPDPHKLRHGEGKVHRHVPLKAPADLRKAGLKELVAAAGAACRERLDKA